MKDFSLTWPKLTRPFLCSQIENVLRLVVLQRIDAMLFSYGPQLCSVAHALWGSPIYTHTH